jgi:hypothetical protein
MHRCPIASCYGPVRHPQQVTCGSPECRDAWRHMSRKARQKAQNLASYSASERALILAQGPSDDELADQQARREQLELERDAYNAKQAHDPIPKFLRDAMNPNNLKGGDITDVKDELPEAQTAQEGTSDRAELKDATEQNEALPFNSDATEDDPIDLKEQPE